MYEVHDLLQRVLPPGASTAATPAARVLRVGDLSFDPERLVVREGAELVALTSREMLVLRYFLQRPGLVVTRRQLLEDVWGYRYTGDDRTVDVHASRLRRKLPSLRDRLVAIKHVGYRLDVELRDEGFELLTLLCHLLRGGFRRKLASMCKSRRECIT